MHRLPVFVFILMFAFTHALPSAAQEKPLRNTVQKKMKIEDVSHRSKYRYSKTIQFVRRGKQAQRFEIRHGDCGGNSYYDDCINDRGRVELKERPKNSMYKPASGVWYGYSMLIPKDFVSLGRANTALGQVKAEGWFMPMWLLSFNDYPFLLFADNSTCKLGSLSSW